MRTGGVAGREPPQEWGGVRAGRSSVCARSGLWPTGGREPERGRVDSSVDRSHETWEPVPGPPLAEDRGAAGERATRMGGGRLVLPTQGAPPAPSSRQATQTVRVGPFHSRGGAQASKWTSRSPPTPRDRPGGEGRRGGQSRAILASRPGAPFSPGSPCKTEQSVSQLCRLRALQRTRPSPRQRFPLRSRLSKDNDRCSRQTRRPRAGSGQPAVSGAAAGLRTEAGRLAEEQARGGEAASRTLGSAVACQV